MAKKQQVCKVILSTKKVVILRELKIADTELAAQAVSTRAGDNPMLMQLFMQKELVKMLLLEIDGKKPSEKEKEDLDSLLTVKEYSQVTKVVSKVAGLDDKGEAEPQLELANIGAD